VARGRVAYLLDPAMQIIGGASGEILDRLDAVLAQGDQHRRADSSDFAQRDLDAELPTPGCKSASPARSAGAPAFCAWAGLAAFRSQKNMAVPSHVRARAPKVVPGRSIPGSRSGRDRRSRNVTQSPLNDQGEQPRSPSIDLSFCRRTPRRDCRVAPGKQDGHDPGLLADRTAKPTRPARDVEQAEFGMRGRTRTQLYGPIPP
jgi:hypothetical protein